MNRDSESGLVERARASIDAARGQTLDPREFAARSVQLARDLLALSETQKTEEFRERSQILSRMMLDRRGQIFTTALTDRAHRSRSGRTTISQATHLLSTLGTPEYLGGFEQFQLGLLEVFGGLAPDLTRKKMLEKIREETEAYILSAEPDDLSRYLKLRREEGIRVNVNHLGEEVLGEEEAQRRVDGYVELLSRPEVDAISVKVSSIFSQLDVLAFDASLARVKERLRPIYRAALTEQQQGHKTLVYLDMEAYRNVQLTLAAFTQLLREDELMELSAGCVLQAYLPDAFGLQAELLEWAKQRVDRGGSAIRVRAVKGANLAMERLESNHHGWDVPIYPSKVEVDANYKRILLCGTRPENANAARLGIASHNLFDVSFGLIARASLGSEERVGFELLEGMADPLRAALRLLDADVLVYAPVVEAEEFPSAIAYLVRRLDENTADENFLRHSFHMQLDDENFCDQERAFEKACLRIDDVSSTPRRNASLDVPAHSTSLEDPFRNEPDTDFTREQDRATLKRALDALDARRHHRLRSSNAQTAHVDGAPDTALASKTGPRVTPGFDPSRPDSTPYEVELADAATVQRALAAGHAACERWASTPQRERSELVLDSAARLRGARAELIAAMVCDGGKRADEADVEVSEAIDFAEYYARSALEVHEHSDVRVSPRGLVVVTPPWNFPLAIPIGGPLAALVIGNPVILKTALETPLVTHQAVKLCHEAGIPRDVLQFLVCEDEVGSQLIRDERTKAVVLTGATSTARLFQELRPTLDLFAETGGKNALIVTPMADREQAIADVISSAFGHAGQKCSALSQLILHRELYDDERFLNTLKDAAASLAVGSAWDLSSRVTPLIQPPNPTQMRAITQLDAGESWLLAPRIDDANPRLVHPGIKLGVKPGSFSHQTEFFCPVLSVLRAGSLEEAVDIANGTPYGLTSGIHTLDEREQHYFIDHIQAGNLYVNRKITGAVVRRQSFGGWKASNFGPGAKAGGPNYVAQFVTLSDGDAPEAVAHRLPTTLEEQLVYLDEALAYSSDAEDVVTVWRERAGPIAERYQRDFELRFATPKDESQLVGQDNFLRYLPVQCPVYVASNHTVVGGEAQRSSVELLRILIAAWVVGTLPAVWLLKTELPAVPLHTLDGLARRGLLELSRFEKPSDVVEAIEQRRPERLRVLGTITPELRNTALKIGAHITNAAPLANGRFELLRHLREQAVSVTYHRYGHVGLREVNATEGFEATNGDG